MCVVSNVFDHYEPLIPTHVEPAWAPKVTITGANPFSPALDLAPLEKLIAEFKEAIEAAKKLDRLMGKPDCEDPDKAKLQARVRELEKDIEILHLKAEVDRLRVICRTHGEFV